MTNSESQPTAIGGLLPNPFALPLSATQGPDLLTEPELFDGIVSRRIEAGIIDFFVLAIATLSGGILAVTTNVVPFVVIASAMPAVVTLAYHVLLISGHRSATIGMQMAGLEVRRLNGERLNVVQALGRVVLICITVLLAWWLLLIAFFNKRHCCFHDWLSGTLVVRTDRLQEQHLN